MNHTPATRLLAAVAVGATALTLSACSKTASPAASGSQQVQGAVTGARGADTAALVGADPAADQGKARHHRKAGRLLHALHATWVTDGKKGVVTHQAIRGAVTAVSATSITVKAKDGFSQTFTASSTTRVLTRDLGAAKGTKPASSSLAAVKVGANAMVLGEGATTPSAKRVLVLTGQKPVKTPKPAKKTPVAPKPSTATS